jgi:hypothetical protein
VAGVADGGGGEAARLRWGGMKVAKCSWLVMIRSFLGFKDDLFLIIFNCFCSISDIS